MKYTIIVPIAAVVLFSAPTPGKNLVANPGFEILWSQDYGWQPAYGWDGFGEPDWLCNDSTEQHSGKYSAMADTRPGACFVGYGQYFYNIPMSEFNSKSFSWWFKIKGIAEGGGDNFWVYVRGYGSGELYYWFHYSDSPFHHRSETKGRKYIDFTFNDTTDWTLEVRNLYQDWVSKGLPADVEVDCISFNNGCYDLMEDQPRGQKIYWDDICLDNEVGSAENPMAVATGLAIWPRLTKGVVNYQSERPFSVFDAAGKRLCTCQGQGQVAFDRAGVYFCRQDNSIVKIVVTR